jgi:type I restriction enzyme, S subunit
VTDLPPGWEATTTAALFEFVTSGSRGWARYYSQNGSHFIRVGNLRRGSIVPDLTDVQFVSPPDGAEGSRTRIASNDILISITADLGRVALMTDVREPAYINQHVALARPVPDINPRYLAWYLTSEAVQRQWARQQRGVTKLGLGLDDIRSIKTPLPPLAEQERIVAAIEEQFSRVDAGAAAIQRVRQNLKRMRAAAFLKMDLAGMEMASPQCLIDVAEFIVDGDHNPPKRTESGIPYLTAKHVKGGKISTDSATFVSEEDYRSLRKRYDPRGGDVLVTCVGTLGEIAVVPAGLIFAADRNLAAIRPAEDTDPRYLAAVLRSPRQRKTLTAGSGSTAQPHLYLKDLRTVVVSVPARKAQTELVEHLEQNLTLIDRLEETITASASWIGALRSSILAAAFSGRLVPQDPADEPASIPLDRTAAERAAIHATRSLMKVTA